MSLFQVTLSKENGSFGMVVRGGDHEVPKRRRPFSIVNLVGAAFSNFYIPKELV